MRRLTLSLVAIAIVIAAGLGTLLYRAMTGAAEQRELAHRIVAERIFDEFARRLNVLVHREDNRPFTHYRYFFVPEDLVPGSVAVSRSPLVEQVQDPFIRGYFQLDPQGSLHSPAWPSNQDLARNSFAWQPDDEVLAFCRDMGRWTQENKHQLQIDNPRNYDNFLVCSSLELPSLQFQSSYDSFASWMPQQASAPSGSDWLSRAPTQQVQVVVDEAMRAQTALPVADDDPDQAAAVQHPAAAPNDPAASVEPGGAATELAMVEQAAVATGQQATGKALNDQDVRRENAWSKGSPNLAVKGVYQERSQGKRQVTVGSASAYQFQNTDDQNRIEEQLFTQNAVYNGNIENFRAWNERQAQQSDGQSSASRSSSQERQQLALQAGQAEADQTAEVEQQAEQLTNQQTQADPANELIDFVQAIDVQQTEAPVDTTEPAATAETNVPATVEPTAAVELDATGQAQADAPSEAGGSAAHGLAPEVSQAVAVSVQLDSLYYDINDKLGIAPDAELAITIDSFRGVPKGDGHQVLYRQVEIQEQIYLQGLVVDMQRLCRDIESTVLAGSELAPYVRMRWHWTGGDLVGSEPFGDAYVFEEVFPAPFADLRAELVLAPLPDTGSTSMGIIYTMVVLVGLVLTIGFWTIRRMVSTRMAYARRRSDFVSAVSHELRTPLTSIRMYGEMLREGMVSNDEQRQHYYHTITAEGERLSRLVDNVLELARLERGERQADVKIGQVDEVLEELVTILEPHAQSKGFSLELTVPERLPPTRFDRDALLQVLVNLVDNSMKFARDSDTKCIRIDADQVDGEVRLRVRDFGPGVPAKVLKRICEPFFRVESELTRRTKGTGIGLALVRNLIERMGGQLRLSNHPEGGFLAAISLPVAAES